MGLFEKIFGPRQVTVQLQGNVTQVSKAEFEGLNRLANDGFLKRSGGDATVGLGTYTQGIPAFWFARAIEAGGGSENLTSPYEKSVWVQRAIKKVSWPIAGVDLRFANPDTTLSQIGKVRTTFSQKQTKETKKRRFITSRGIVRRAEEDFIEMPDIMRWLKHPMKGLTYSDYVEASVGWLKMQECFWLLSDEVLVPFPEARTEYPPVIVARPDMMREVIEKGELIGWVFRDDGGKQHKLLPDQVIQLRYWNPYNKWRGLGEYPSAHIAAEADYLAGKFSRNLMANNGDFGGVIIAKNGPPTDPQREQIIMDLRAKRQAQLRGEMRYTFLTGDIDVKDPKIVSVDQAFNAQRLENRHEIALAFGVPPSMFDVKAAYSIGSASDYYQLITDACIPTGVKFCDALETLINKLTGEVVECVLDWETHPVMQAVRREAFDSWDKLCNRGMPAKLAGEYLGLDLPSFAGDDTGFVPINITPIEQASEPPPEPGSDESLAETSNSKPQTPSEDQTPEPVKEMIRLLKRGNGAPVKRSEKKANSKKLWEKHMRLRSGTVRAYQSKVNRVLNEFRGKALARMEIAKAKNIEQVAPGENPLLVTRSLIDFIFDAKEFSRHLVLAIRPVAQAAIETATEQLADEIGRKDDPWKMPPPMVKEILANRETEVQGCGETVRGQLNTALKAGIEEGESIEDLSDRVRGVFNNLSRYESRRIAQTETAAVFSKARHEAMDGSGIKYKSWLSSHGPNVRPAHEAAEERYSEEPIQMDEPFVVDGEELMHPGDPDGSAGNVINCQCIELAAKAPDSTEEGEEE